jgi:hypothetical protein
MSDKNKNATTHLLKNASTRSDFRFEIQSPESELAQLLPTKHTKVALVSLFTVLSDHRLLAGLIPLAVKVFFATRCPPRRRSLAV